MRRGGASRAIAALLVWVALCWSVVAAAGANDEVVQQIISDTMSTDYANKKHQAALENLGLAKVACEGGACSAAVRAEIDMAIGVVHADGLKNPGSAKKAFARALNIDKEAKLDPSFAGPKSEAALSEMRKKKAKRSESGCREKFDGRKTPRGWKDPVAAFCWLRSLTLYKKKQYKACIADARTSYEIEGKLDSYSSLARCLEGAGRWLEAVGANEELTTMAVKRRKLRIASLAKQRARRLRRRMPTLTLKATEGGPAMVVKLDGDILPPEQLNVEIPLDPGKHSIKARTKGSSVPLGFAEVVDLSGGDSVVLPLKLGLPDYNCIVGAKTDEELVRCLGRRKSDGVSWRVTSEVAGYHDDMNVDVISPAIATSVEDTLNGWGVNAGFIVDVVTAASVDILATASPRWREVRYAPSLGGHKRFGPVDITLRGSLSHEPDYIASSVGTSLSVDLRDKTITPTIGYEYSHDINGRKKTPFAVFSRLIDRHAINAGLGLVLTKATYGGVSFTFVHEDGDGSKPYRYVPVFPVDRTTLLQPGASLEQVNQLRLNARVLEQLPLERQRYAGALLLAHRFAGATIRGSQRVYGDSWGSIASTTDVRHIVDVVDHVRLWPHVRFHAQGAANFYRLAYGAVQQGSQLGVPLHRTGDRELGPMYALTIGGGGRLGLGERDQVGIALSGDFIYSKFLDHLFVSDRLGFFGALALEAEL